MYSGHPHCHDAADHDVNYGHKAGEIEEHGGDNRRNRGRELEQDVDRHIDVYQKRTPLDANGATLLGGYANMPWSVNKSTS
jgi:hypothetical protein